MLWVLFPWTGGVIQKKRLKLYAGSGLHIGKLSLDGGELHVDGHIEGINYEEPAQPRRGMFSRLFV